MAFNLINTIVIIIIVSVIITAIIMITTFLLLWLLALSTLSATSSLSQEFTSVFHEPKSFLFPIHRNSSWLTSYPQSQCVFHWRFTLILPPRVWVSMKVVLQETVGSPPLRCLRSTTQQANRLENQNRVQTNRGTRKACAAHLITVPLWYKT